MLRDNEISICDHELIKDNYKCHRYLGGCHELIDIFSEKEYNKWKVQKKILFLDQIIEHDKEYLMKWQHFFVGRGFINYGGGEPMWYKRLKRYKGWNGLGIYYTIDESITNNDFDSSWLKKCAGCYKNISRNREDDVCLIHCNIEDELSREIKIRKITQNELSSNEGSVKPFERLLPDDKYVNIEINKKIIIELETFKNETINWSHDDIEDISDFNTLEIGIIWSNILVDEYNLRWNNFIIEGCYRKCDKDLSYLNNKAEMKLLKQLEQLFVINISFNWPISFMLIRNEIKVLNSSTSAMDSQTRAFRIKNLIQLLPTYDVLYQRRVYGVSLNKCVRCNDEVETWDHL
ncbi:hypothetical protein C1646_765992 [Rhizophagus diaphanus]|nr:hypothetical protein C1646_765992 [Rhizophagus diaphanus] [Rhizophagus sp. MUCL 43196]